MSVYYVICPYYIANLLSINNLQGVKGYLMDLFLSGVRP